MLLEVNPNIVTIKGYSLKYYTVFILIGVLVAWMMFVKEGKKHNKNDSFLYDVAFWTVLCGIVGARLYYVAFNFSLYKNNLIDILKMWEGGLAIHGGIIAGFWALFVVTKLHKEKVIDLTDYAAPGLFFAQALGRWGNFFNGEAHGVATTLAKLKAYHFPEFIIEGMHIDDNYYIPTFLYESVWCLLGLIIILIVRKFKLVKKGMPTAIYLMWYSIGRFFIESLRTDSLMFGTFKVAQIVSLVMFLIGLIILMVDLFKTKYENLYNEG